MKTFKQVEVGYVVIPAIFKRASDRGIRASSVFTVFACVVKDTGCPIKTSGMTD